jgi:hypothetical protein
MSSNELAPRGGDILIYQTEGGQTKIQVRLEGETLWLSQADLAQLYQTTKQNISLHIQNIYEEGELDENSVVKEYLTTAADGKNYKTKYYNLDMIISVGYRVKSHIATHFRQWATQRLREYIVKGFVLDDERLKNPDLPFDYFDELLRRIQDIRTSERRFYQKITDIYATSVDYDVTSGQMPTSPIWGLRIGGARKCVKRMLRSQRTISMKRSFQRSIISLSSTLSLPKARPCGEYRCICGTG